MDSYPWYLSTHLWAEMPWKMWIRIWKGNAQHCSSAISSLVPLIQYTDESLEALLSILCFIIQNLGCSFLYYSACVVINISESCLVKISESKTWKPPEFCIIVNSNIRGWAAMKCAQIPFFSVWLWIFSFADICAKICHLPVVWAIRVMQTSVWADKTSNSYKDATLKNPSTLQWCSFGTQQHKKYKWYWRLPF